MHKNIIKILLGKRARSAPISTLAEAFRMRFGSHRLLFSEYIAYHLHDYVDSMRQQHSYLDRPIGQKDYSTQRCLAHSDWKQYGG